MENDEKIKKPSEKFGKICYSVSREHKPLVMQKVEIHFPNSSSIRFQHTKFSKESQ
jgi:hypothetical protein